MIPPGHTAGDAFGSLAAWQSRILSYWLLCAFCIPAPLSEHPEQPSPVPPCPSLPAPLPPLLSRGTTDLWFEVFAADSECGSLLSHWLSFLLDELEVTTGLIPQVETAFRQPHQGKSNWSVCFQWD